MNIATNSQMQPATGRAKTVIVMETGDGLAALVSEIIVHKFLETSDKRLIFKGPVRFKNKSKQHLNDIVLPVAERVSNSLGVPFSNYQVSVKNIGAAASAGIGMKISGFSADMPVLLALLSASLQVKMRQDVICTGHLASLDGDLAPVRSIPAKLEAAIQNPLVTEFVLPKLDADNSMQLLTPVEYQLAKESILHGKGDIKIHPVSSVFDAAQLCYTDESIVLGSLMAGFFSEKPTVSSSQSHLENAVRWLARGNEKRFWDALSSFLLNGLVEEAKLYLKRFAEFHIRNQIYPENIGEKLFHLVLSLPPAKRRTHNLFPLLPMGDCIRLSQFAQERFQNDVRKLYKAAFDDGIRDKFRPEGITDRSETKDGFGDWELLQDLLAEISQENLFERVGKPIDEARSTYVADAVTVNNGFEFNETVTAFYAHMFLHLEPKATQIEKETFSAGAIDLVTKAFEQNGGYKAALNEGKHGINGGMRIVFDAMTEHLKQTEKEKYINMVFKDRIDSLEWGSQVRLMELFKEHIDPYLPDHLRELPAKQLATDWESILKYFSKSLDNFFEKLKRL